MESATGPPRVQEASLGALLALLVPPAQRSKVRQGSVDLAELARPGFEGAAALWDLPLRSRLRIQAALELGRRLTLPTSTARPIIRGLPDVLAALGSGFPHEPVEEFRVLLLDARHRVMAIPTVSRGTLTASLVHPREVLRPALLSRSAAVILAHNHPSGDPEPSREDDEVTTRLVRAGQILGIPVLDHVIVACHGTFDYRGSRPERLDAKGLP